MSDITVSDTAKYNANKRMQTYGILLGTLLPLAPIIESHNMYHEKLPRILDEDQATTICLQEDFEATSVTEKGFHINLTKPEIDTCAATEIAKSQDAQDAYIQNHEDNSWKVMALSGALTAGCFGMAATGFVSNRRMRKEKPGIKEAAKQNPTPPKMDL